MNKKSNASMASYVYCDIRSVIRSHVMYGMVSNAQYNKLVSNISTCIARIGAVGKYC